MEDQHDTARLAARAELHATPLGRALWQSVRGPRRGRSIIPAPQPGPYETQYTISNGYEAEPKP